MNNIQTYEDFLNEGIISDKFKEKFSKLWNNFQYKEEVTRKLYNFLRVGNIPFTLLYLALLCNHYWPKFLGADIKHFFDPAFNGMIMVTLYLIFQSNYVFNILRDKVIKKELNRLREKFHDGNIFLVLGDKSNIDKAIAKLKEDGIISDEHIINEFGRCIIDFSGRANIDKEEHYNVDPYGEEDWNDNGAEDEMTLTGRRNLAHILEPIYGVRFRKITDEFDLFSRTLLSSSGRDKEQDLRYYNQGVDEFRRRNDPAPAPDPNLNLNHNIIPAGEHFEGEVVNMNGANWEVMGVDELNGEMVALIRRMQPGEEIPEQDQGIEIPEPEIDQNAQPPARNAEYWKNMGFDDVEDLEDGRVAVKVKKPKRKILNYNNFVVPGFDKNYLK
jgi:hypothetical protein